MTTLTEPEIRAYHTARDAERDAEFAAKPPAGSDGFTRREWSSLTLGDQAYYARGGRRTPNEWMPEETSLTKMAEALSLTPSPSISSGYRVWAFDLLDWLDRQGWKLVRK